eukprot:5593306-Prymnesium_polylepis.1
MSSTQPTTASLRHISSGSNQKARERSIRSGVQASDGTPESVASQHFIGRGSNPSGGTVAPEEGRRLRQRGAGAPDERFAAGQK